MPPAAEKKTPPGDKPRQPSGRFGTALKKAASGQQSIHPALVPGISVEDTNTKFPTRIGVFAAALTVAVGFILWAAIVPDSIADVGSTMQSWVVRNLGWMYGAITVACVVFMIVIACRPTGRIKLGPDDAEPDFSTAT